MYKEKRENFIKEQDLTINNVEERWMKIKTCINTNAEKS
jgi:hypothetical protein